MGLFDNGDGAIGTFGDQEIVLPDVDREVYPENDNNQDSNPEENVRAKSEDTNVDSDDDGIF